MQPSSSSSIGTENQSNTVDIKQFSDIVGSLKLQELEEVSERNVVNKTQDFQCLYKIYKTLLSNSDVEPTVNIMEINDFVFVSDEFNLNWEPPVIEQQYEQTDSEHIIEVSPGSVNSSELQEVQKIKEDSKPIKGIEQYIRWVKTPERKKTNKSKENVPFVVTSSGYSKIQEEKRKLKEQKELEKEQRQLQRKQNIEDKKKIKEQKTKLKNQKTKVQAKLPKKSLPIRKLTFKEFAPFEDLAQNSYTALLEENISVVIIPDRNNLNSDQANNEFGEHPQEMERVSTDHTNDMIILEPNDVDVLPQNDNNDNHFTFTASGKMCYHCTYSFNKNNKGVRCEQCTAEFHISCVNKLNLPVNPHFLCTLCQNKKI